MDERPDPPTALAAIRQRWRFTAVLLASLLLAVAQPLMSGLFEDRGTFDVFFSLLIAAVLLLVFQKNEHRRVVIALAMAAFLGVWTSHWFGGLGGRILLVAAHLVAACFFVFALYGILRAILAEQASGDAIFGAICGYLLLGIIWTLLYSAAETAFPGSFCVRASDGTQVVSARPDRCTLSYYSFITLATVGYGDVTPTTQLTQTLAWMEAITGQFYLAVLVAGLVGFKVTQAKRD